MFKNKNKQRYNSDPYYLPAYSNIKINYYTLDALPKNYKFVKEVYYKHKKKKFLILKHNNDYYGCLTNSGQIAFEHFTDDNKNLWCMGFKRSSIKEVESVAQLFNDGQDAPERNIRKRLEFKKSPSMLRLKRSAPTATRYCGAVFKNIETDEEVTITTSYKEVFLRLKFSPSNVNAVLYDAKIVKNWYLDRVEPGYGPIGNVKKGAVRGSFVKNTASVNILLPMQSIMLTTGLSISQIKNLYTRQYEEINGWRFIQEN
jgi:hypothetical protein